MYLVGVPWVSSLLLSVTIRSTCCTVLVRINLLMFTLPKLWGSSSDTVLSDDLQMNRIFLMLWKRQYTWPGNGRFYNNIPYLAVTLISRKQIMIHQCQIFLWFWTDFWQGSHKILENLGNEIPWLSMTKLVIFHDHFRSEDSRIFHKKFISGQFQKPPYP